MTLAEKKRKFFLSLVLLAFAAITPIVYEVERAIFNQKCGSYLEQAANASDPELAIRSLNVAIAYAEEHGIVDGYTSILWKTEDENVGFWFDNLKAHQKNLSNAIKGSEAEKNTAMINLKASLLRYTEDGTKLVVPEGIHVFPHNRLFAVLNFLSFLIACYVAWKWYKLGKH